MVLNAISSTVVTFPEAAAILGVSRQTVYKMVARGSLQTVVDVGGHRFLDSGEVWKLANKRKGEHTNGV